MADRYISEVVRSEVAKRAAYRCEYCLLFEKYSYFKFHIEHIVSLKHGGQNEPSNLALACPQCNMNKGSDVATFLAGNEEPTRFYNPRKDAWREHFRAEESGEIVAISKIGEATIKVLGLNQSESIMERKLLIDKRLF